MIGGPTHGIDTAEVRAIEDLASETWRRVPPAAIIY